jgi:hypothetical protein
MAMACRLVNRNLNVRVLLAAEIADHLSHDNVEALLQDEYLFIPDLQVWPAIFGCEERLTKRLLNALDKRRARCLPTIVYFDTPGALGLHWELFFSWFYLGQPRTNLVQLASNR